MSRRRAVRALLAVFSLVAVLAMDAVSATPAKEHQDAAAVVAHLRELLAKQESKLVIVPFPNSRSRILKADGSSDFFLYIERGGLRGAQSIDEFYAKLDAGDIVGADEVFSRNSLVSLRVSDYGWNGLGVPMVTGEGNEIQDRLFKTVGGVFGPADVTDEDVATYLEYIETILIPALENGGR